MINPTTFVEHLEQLWVEDYRLTASPKLREAWSCLCCHLNEVIGRSAFSESKELSVVPMPTGTGKTLGLAVYAALLPSTDHPGVLVVVRLKTEADELVTMINNIAGAPMAVAKHTDTDTTTDQLKASPVLVITHEALRRSLSLENGVSQAGVAFGHLSAWDGGVRSLTVIDEAFDLVHISEVSLSSIVWLRAFIDNDLSRDYPKEAEVLLSLDQVLTKASSSQDEAYALLSEHSDLWSDDLDFVSFTKALKSAACKHALRDVVDQENWKALVMYIERCMHCVQTIRRKGLAHITTQARIPKLLAATLLMPEDHNTVVLDATATLDAKIHLLGDRVEILKLPKGVRNYQNLTLKVSRGHRVGKTGMIDNPDTVADVMGLARRIQQGTENLLVCTHKDIAGGLREGLREGENISAAHWGRIDGSNEWADFSSVLIAGLPYVPRHVHDMYVMASHGANADVSRSSSGGVFLGKRIGEMEAETIAAKLVQAINRIRCRRVADALGGCLPCEAHLLLPSGRDGDLILDSLIASMPGVRVEHALYRELLSKKRVGTRFDCFVEALRRYSEPRVNIKVVCDEAGIASATRNDFIRTKLINPDKETQELLNQINRRIEVTGKGTGRQVWAVSKLESIEGSAKSTNVGASSNADKTANAA